MQLHLPRRLTVEEMEREAGVALHTFVQERLAEGTSSYAAAFRKAKRLVSRLFERTENLTVLDGKAICGSTELVEAARFLGGPPLSQDDLNTLAGGPVCSRKGVDEKLAARTIEVIRSFLDPFRYPWIASGRPPTKTAVRNAIAWTSSLWAVEKCRTSRRTESSAVQERRVEEILASEGLRKEGAIRKIDALDDLDRGRFTREVVLGGAKADLAVRLLDGRLLAIECKVSNSAINSVKRLNRETAGKAGQWRDGYGKQVVSAAVLSGVFKVGNLVDAQTAGVHIFWDHDLSSLRTYIQETCQS